MSPASLIRKPRILYLDAYDSFSNNIVAQVKQCLGVEVIQIRIDDARFFKRSSTATNDATKPESKWSAHSTSFQEYLSHFDAVIAGPGPGWAGHENDIGLIKELWELQDADILPVLGVCLGFQSLSLAFGAKLKKLTEPQHGIVHEILHKDRSIFSNVDQLMATQYHSLHIDVGHSIQTKGAVSYPSELWAPTEQCPELEPLAWDFDNPDNGAVLMGVKHISKPFWGVQFHPESICTNSEGNRIIQNWWACAQMWKREARYTTTPRKRPLSTPVVLNGPGSFDGVTTKKQSITTIEQPLGFPLPSDEHMQIELNMEKSSSRSENATTDFANLILSSSLPHLPPERLEWATAGSGRLTVQDACETFGVGQGEAIVLQSGLQPNLLPMAVGTGRYSIIGLVLPGETTRIHYYIGSRKSQSRLEIKNGDGEVIWRASTSDPWGYIKAFMKCAKPVVPPREGNAAPFWGGLMGYASYEAGLETIDVETLGHASYPDICFAYITRSVVFDHQLKKIYIQSLRGDDDAWIQDARDNIYEAAYLKSQNTSPNPTPSPKPNPFETNVNLNTYLASCNQHVAKADEYCHTVKACQNFIANGHSYELCLTTQNKITAQRPKACVESKVENNELSWNLYKRMTSRNPAPFSAYLRMNNIHVLSSSPERYICWNRAQTAQCRPIKGTVQKGTGITAAHAQAILSSSKERAENLMIVDLVRHQLHGVYGAGNVKVSQLMEVEEYETLWQLVSVVDAIPASINKLPTPEDECQSSDYLSSESKTSSAASREDTLGFDAFVQSLPAGSMTGAPKKRSCEALQFAEHGERRGIYSGVLGYFDVGGGGDFSVVIRTAVKVDNPDNAVDVWRIGAGGAITSQSDPQAEYDEMKGKFQSAARAFQPGSCALGDGDALGSEASKAALADLIQLLENPERMGRDWRGNLEAWMPLIPQELNPQQQQSPAAALLGTIRGVSDEEEEVVM